MNDTFPPFPSRPIAADAKPVYFQRCPHASKEYPDGSWWCECHGAGGIEEDGAVYGLVVAEGTIIEIGDEAAERMARWRWDKARSVCEEANYYDIPPRWSNVDRAIRRRWTERALEGLRAAAGEEALAVQDRFGGPGNRRHHPQIVVG